MGELESEAQSSRADAAAILQDLAAQLEAGGDVTLELGAQRVTVDPVEPITVKLEGESDWSTGDTEAKQSIEFELVWWRAAESAQDASLQLERIDQQS